MKNSLFYAYWKLVAEGFYTKEEKNRIFKLLTSANGEAEACTEKMLNVLDELSDSDEVGLQNRMLVARFSQNSSEYYYDAVRSYFKFQSTNKNDSWFSGRPQWMRHMLCTASDSERGFFYYAIGDISEAIKSFNKALSRELNQWPLYEILAIVNFELKDYEEALNNSAKALWIGEQKLNIPTIDYIAEQAMKALEITDIEEVRKRAFANFGERKIGF